MTKRCIIEWIAVNSLKIFVFYRYIWTYKPWLLVVQQVCMHGFAARAWVHIYCIIPIISWKRTIQERSQPEVKINKAKIQCSVRTAKFQTMPVFQVLFVFLLVLRNCFELLIILWSVIYMFMLHCIVMHSPVIGIDGPPDGGGPSEIRQRSGICWQWTTLYPQKYMGRIDLCKPGTLHQSMTTWRCVFKVWFFFDYVFLNGWTTESGTAEVERTSNCSNDFFLLGWGLLVNFQLSFICLHWLSSC